MPYIFVAILAVFGALAGVATYYRTQAAKLPVLEHALDLSLDAIQKQDKAIAAQVYLAQVQDDLYAQATAERTEGVRVITVYREKQRADATNNPEVARWSADRVPDAVIERLRQHDARYGGSAGADQTAAFNDGRNAGAGRPPGRLDQ